MADAIATSADAGRHLVVQAGTGTGKTLAYLVPLILRDQKMVVATATKALQDQLATKDLPFLTAHLGHPFEWAVLKGRSNYVCLQRVRELATPAGGQLELDGMPASVQAEVARIAEWIRTTDDGDLASLDWSPSDRTWQALSVSSDECPGAAHCPMGESCFAEAARQRANVADVVVVNLHLYALDVASGGSILPDHEVVVFDEAHQLEDVTSEMLGVQIGATRFARVAAALRQVLADPSIAAAVTDSGSVVADAVAPLLGQRLPRPLPDDVHDGLVAGRARVDAALAALRNIDTKVPEAQQRALRATQLCTRLVDSIDSAMNGSDGTVTFVGGTPERPHLEVAPLQVGALLHAGVWAKRTAVLTSATIPSSLVQRVGLDAEQVDQLDVGSPFDYESNALLYCPVHLPDPRSPAYIAAMHDELLALIAAAGGRTLALFTSWKAMDAAATVARERLSQRIFTQRDLPKAALVRAFSGDETSCLFATAGFFQGIDIPGRTLSLVTVDRIPFPRPDDPLLSARRELLGPAAFRQIDLPRASMLLAQATGRLIRTSADRGVVAVLDPRLGTAGYRWDIVRALPPMRRTRHRAEAEAFLREITA